MTTTHSDASQRRELRFDSFDEVLDEAQRLVAGDKVNTVGNWSLGQILMHLALAIDTSIDGADFKVPLYVRWVGPLMKKRILKKMSSGFQLPASAKKQLVADDSTTAEQGLAALRQSIERLSQTDQRAPHVVFGKMSGDEWHQLHLRHAEMHLSFVDVAD